ncbi:MAG: HEPN domain-containing protein [Elusimicrobia bacterium CG06_land_8_20_14_3_00_38_11]|nr:MAG: HEPN domain-containing protein [Elusimicrobia bacterium CG06_land_8_20_14_3_00_38_11]
MEKKLKIKVEKFLQKADKKIKASEKLFENELYDDTLSRAYYAMFFSAEALLLIKDLSAKTHSGVLFLLNEYFVKTGEVDRNYFEMIRKSKETRENGDYDAFYEATENEAKISIENAKKFVDKIKDILEVL